MSMINEFVEKLRERLGNYEYSHLVEHDTEECLHCRENEDDWCNCRNCFICVWDKAEAIVKELAEEYKDVSDTNVGKWIPVSERLPDKEGKYLVTLKRWNMVTIANFKNVMGYKHFDNGYVIAWQLLPEPYKPE